MRNIYRIMAMMVFLATVGQFLIDLRGAIHQIGETGPPPNVAGRGPPAPTVEPEKSTDTPIPPEQACDWKIYEPTIARFKSEPKPADVDRFKWLGADPHHQYFYDYATGRIYCTEQPKPKGPLVHPAQKRITRRRHMAILYCIVVIVVSFLGLTVIEMIRSAQKNRKNKK